MDIVKPIFKTTLCANYHRKKSFVNAITTKYKKRTAHRQPCSKHKQRKKIMFWGHGNVAADRYDVEVRTEGLTKVVVRQF